MDKIDEIRSFNASPNDYLEFYLLNHEILLFDAIA